MMTNTIVRASKVAGQFYPQEALELTRELEFFLSKNEGGIQVSDVKKSAKNIFFSKNISTLETSAIIKKKW